MTFVFRQLTKEDAVRGGALEQALNVMREAFAGMEGRIDPPSSLHELTFDKLCEVVEVAEVWAAKNEASGPVIGTVTLTPKKKVLYVGKLAVRSPRAGLGRALMALAEDRAGALGYSWLELESRVELVEVHDVFKRLGYREVGRTTHDGYLKPTSVVFRKNVG